MFIKYSACVESINKPTGVIHVGAHEGQEGVQYAQNGVEKVVWVEANPDWVKILKEKTATLNVKEQHYFCNLISDKDDIETDFNISNNQQSSSMLELGTHKIMYPHIKYIDKKKMKTKRMDTLLKENSIDIKNYQFLNVDVQGAELKVLKGFGALLGHFNALYLEVNKEEVYQGCALIGEINEYVEQFGFKHTRERMERGKWGDALYLKQL